MKGSKERLTGAKKAKRSWVEVASLFRKGLEESGGSGGAAFQRETATNSGYTVGMLKRFVVALNFIESLPERTKPKPTVVEASFTAIELIERINRRNPAKAREILGTLGQPGTRVSAIRKELKNLRDEVPLEFNPHPARRMTLVSAPVPRSYAASARRMREEITYEKVEALLPKLSGPIVVFHRPLGVAVAPVRTDAIAWLDENYETADGFEFIYAPSSMTETLFSDQLNRAVVAATFFRRYFLVFTADSDSRFPRRAIDILKLLEAGTIGVVELAAKDPRPLKPKDEPPVPDRRGMLKKICPQGRWA
ncbi:hypothetical protein SAMN05444050_4250 [Afipia sp. GAS231]|nr:hypothetical protein SAMN05444050_4250 [Afipia sp. GAS231]